MSIPPVPQAGSYTSSPGLGSNKLTKSKLNDTKINEIFVQDIINNEFDNIEDWVGKIFNRIRAKL